MLEVPSGSRAEAIGIRERDVILRFDDINIDSVIDLMDHTYAKKSGILLR